MLQRPLASVTVAYVVGLLLGDILQPSPGLWMLLLPIAVVGVFLAGRYRLALVLAAAVIAGGVNIVWRTAVMSPHDLRALVGTEPELVTVRATLLETPVVRSSQSYSRKPGADVHRSVVRARVTGLVRKDSPWQAALGDVLVSSVGDLPPDYGPGRCVQIHGKLAPPPGSVAKGLFDYATWLRRNYIYYQLQAAGPGDWAEGGSVVVPGEGPNPAKGSSTTFLARECERFLVWARHTLSLGLPEVDEPLELLWSMTLGEKGVVPMETYEPFIISGTMHIFAISGLHVALICAILLNLLRVLRFSRQSCGSVVIPLLWFYTVATGMQASAVRSTIMMSIIVFGWMLSRPSDLINSLCAAALIILVWDPSQLFLSGFQLSFLVVLSLALFMPVFTGWIDLWLAIDPLLPAILEPRWKATLRDACRWLLLSLATSFASWLGSIPLTVLYFNVFSPVTLLANLAVVPMSSAALASNMGALACGDWFPSLTATFNHGAWFWMCAMMSFSQWCIRIPGAWFYVGAPSLLECFLAYALFLTILAGGITRANLRPWTLPAILVALFCVGAGRYLEGRLSRLTVLPSESGAAIYFRSGSGGGNWVMDPGTSNAVRFVTKPFLQAQGVNRLSAMVLSHGNQNCIGGAGWVQEQFAPRHVVVSPMRFRSPTYRRLMAQFEPIPGLLQRVHRHDTLGEWRILHPSEGDKFARADDASLVLRGELNRIPVLILGDLGPLGQRTLLENPGDLSAAIVVAGIPTEGEPLGEALLDAIRPEAIILCEANRSAFQQARQPLITRLAMRKIPVFYTSSDGAATLSIRANTWQITTMNGRSAQGIADPLRPVAGD